MSLVVLVPGAAPARAACDEGLGLRMQPPVITAGQASVLELTDQLPAGTRVEVHAYTQPSTDYSVVRSAELEPGVRGGAGEDGFYRTALRPPRSTRLLVTATTEECTRRSDSAVLPVRSALTLDVRTVGPRTVEASGRHVPARPGKVVTLYRAGASGPVIVAQSRVRDDGTWQLRRTFQAGGELVLWAGSGADALNAAGASGRVTVRLR